MTSSFGTTLFFSFQYNNQQLSLVYCLLLCQTVKSRLSIILFLTKPTMNAILPLPEQIGIVLLYYASKSQQVGWISLLLVYLP